MIFLGIYNNARIHNPKMHKAVRKPSFSVRRDYSLRITISHICNSNSLKTQKENFMHICYIAISKNIRALTYMIKREVLSKQLLLVWPKYWEIIEWYGITTSFSDTHIQNLLRVLFKQKNKIDLWLPTSPFNINHLNPSPTVLPMLPPSRLRFSIATHLSLSLPPQPTSSTPLSLSPILGKQLNALRKSQKSWKSMQTH